MLRALEAGEFIPYFQPVVHGDTKQWSGAEVLMRWNHPKEGWCARICLFRLPNIRD